MASQEAHLALLVAWHALRRSIHAASGDTYENLLNDSREGDISFPQSQVNMDCRFRGNDRRDAKCGSRGRPKKMILLASFCMIL